jgi:hypothetical protein
LEIPRHQPLIGFIARFYSLLEYFFLSLVSDLPLAAVKANSECPRHMHSRECLLGSLLTGSLNIRSSRVQPMDSPNIHSSRVQPMDSLNIRSSRVQPMDSPNIHSNRERPMDSPNTHSNRLFAKNLFGRHISI